MSFSVVWFGVQGKSPAAFLERAGYSDTGEEDAFADADVSGATYTGGYVTTGERPELMIYVRFADESQLNHPLDIRIRIALGAGQFLGGDKVGVDAGQANGFHLCDAVGVCAVDLEGLVACSVDGADDGFVDAARQHHLDDLHRCGVGDAQAILECGFDAELFQHAADLRAAAMDNDRVDAEQLARVDKREEYRCSVCSIFASSKKPVMPSYSDRSNLLFDWIVIQPQSSIIQVDSQCRPLPKCIPHS